MRLRAVGRVKGFSIELAALRLAGWPVEKPASPSAASAVVQSPSPVLPVCHPDCTGRAGVESRGCPVSRPQGGREQLCSAAARGRAM